MSEMNIVKKSRRNIRKPIAEDEDYWDEVDIQVKLDKAKLLQKLRHRPRGIDVLELTLEKKEVYDDVGSMKEEITRDANGLTNVQNLKKELSTASYSEIGTQFSAETNRRDEDEEMHKYIEKELKNRLGYKKMDDANKTDVTRGTKRVYSAEEAALMSVPKYLKESMSSSKKSEEMLSNQILNGIPEVDLGIAVKIRNIEETDEAKRKLIEKQRQDSNSKDSSFVAANVAVNFIEHNRHRFAQPKNCLKSETKVSQNFHQKATDKLVYDKFRKLHN